MTLSVRLTLLVALCCALTAQVWGLALAGGLLARLAVRTRRPTA